MENQNEDNATIHTGKNRAQRRKEAHKLKPYALQEEKRKRAKIARKRKNALKKRNKGNQG